MSAESESNFNPVQYAFFDNNNGQWVFRGITVGDVQGLLDQLVEAVDETDGPGILTTLKNLKEAGVLKDQAVAAARGTTAAAAPAGNANSSGLPDWVVAEVTKRNGDVAQVRSGPYKSKPGTWYKLGDEFLTQPRRG